MGSGVVPGGTSVGGTPKVGVGRGTRMVWPTATVQSGSSRFSKIRLSTVMSYWMAMARQESPSLMTYEIGGSGVTLGVGV